MKKRVLFISRDGTLIKAPVQDLIVSSEGLPHNSKVKTSPRIVDGIDQWEFLPGVIRSLYFIRKNLDFELVMIINPDESKTATCPQETVDRIQTKILELLSGEGITFDRICTNMAVDDEPSPMREPESDALKTNYKVSFNMAVDDETAPTREPESDELETNYKVSFNMAIDDEPPPTRQLEMNLMKYFMNGAYDLQNSYLIGNSLTDMQLADSIECRYILLAPEDKIQTTPIAQTTPSAQTDQTTPIYPTTQVNDMSQTTPIAPTAPIALSSWDQIKAFLFAGERQAVVQRTTKETDVHIRLNLDGNGICDISTGIGFFNHMLEQIGKHGGLDLTIKVKGDLVVDEHHTIEDTAIALGEAIYQALSNKRGIERYGYCLPMDDCLCTVALDFGGRSWLVWDVSFHRERVGDMPTEMFFHFFKSFSDAAKMNLHIKAEGENEHHKAEGIFKALAKAIKMAVKRDIYKYNLPTTKGSL